MKNRYIRMLGCSTAAFVAAPAMAQTATPAPVMVPQSLQGNGTAVSALSDDTGDEIIVTASKREERLQDVPASITAISGDTLARIGAQGFRDYASLTPGLSLRDLGNPGMGTIILRGLNTGPQQISNTAATYIDDAPFSASGFLSAGAFITPDPDIADLDRVEVLKGPQGTLYGANSLGGLVRIVSRRPQLDAFSGMATAEGTTIDGGGQGYAFRGALNLPIVRDQLAIRMNGVYRRAPGWTDNVFTGTHNVNDTIIKGGRLAIRWRPSDALTLDLNGIVQDIDNKGYAQEDEVTDTLTPRYGRNRYRNGLDVGAVLKYRLASGTATYDFGPVSLIGTASYTKYASLIRTDVTETYISYLRAASPTIAAIIPATAIGVGDNSPNMKKFSTEVRLVSKRLGPVEFVAGGFYTNEKNLYRTIITVNTAAGTPLTAPFDLLFVAHTISNYEEAAAFGNLTFYLSDKLDITSGIRYAHNSQFAQTGGPGAISFYAPRGTGNFTFKENVATYLATIRWRPTSNISFYARAADGYRPGGPQNNPAPPPDAQITIRPDTVWNYEAGVKANFGKLTANASIYHIDWKDIQINTLLNGITLQANGGKAKVDGFEVELTARPTPLTTISANAGHTNARISRIDPGVRASIGANPGDKLPLTPDWTVAILGDQQIPFGDTVRGNIGATLRFRSDMPSSYSGSLLNPNIKIPDLTTLDLRVGVNFPTFTMQLRAENLLNAHGYLSVATNKIVPTQGAPTQAIVNRPRSFILSLGARL